MKGFGYSREKDLLALAIKKRSLTEVEKILVQLGLRLSEEQIGSVVFEVMGTLPQDDMAWAYENLVAEDSWAEMLDEILGMLYEILRERGFKPGIDFSATDEGLRMSREASEAILADMPEELRSSFEDFIKVGAIAIEESSGIEELESELGVPFVENLLMLIGERIPTLTDGQAATYIGTICNGVEVRTAIAMHEIVVGRFGYQKRLSRIFQVLERGKLQRNNDWAYDLLRAAGGESEIQPDPEHSDGHILSDRGWELLGRVFEGPDGSPVREFMKNMHRQLDK